MNNTPPDSNERLSRLFGEEQTPEQENLQHQAEWFWDRVNQHSFWCRGAQQAGEHQAALSELISAEMAFAAWLSTELERFGLGRYTKGGGKESEG